MQHSVLKSASCRHKIGGKRFTLPSISEEQDEADVKMFFFLLITLKKVQTQVHFSHVALTLFHVFQISS